MEEMTKKAKKGKTLPSGESRKNKRSGVFSVRGNLAVTSKWLEPEGVGALGRGGASNQGLRQFPPHHTGAGAEVHGAAARRVAYRMYAMKSACADLTLPRGESIPPLMQEAGLLFLPRMRSGVAALGCSRGSVPLIQEHCSKAKTHPAQDR